MADISYHTLNKILLVGILVNVLCFAIFLFFKSPKTIHSVETVITNHVIVVTNYIDTASATSKLAPHMDIVTSLEYDFMEIGGLPVAFDGYKYLRSGSRTPWGRVRLIYPQQIVLEDGKRIANTKKRPSLVASSTDTSTSPIRSRVDSLAREEIKTGVNNARFN